MTDTAGSPKRVRRSLDETRRLVLDAGIRLALDLGVKPMVDVKLVDAAEAVGLTTGSAYKIWRNQDEFQEDLALHLASSFEWARISSLLPTLQSAPQEWNAWKVAHAYFEAFTRNRAFFVALQFWGVEQPKPELTAAMREGYEIVSADTEEIVELYLHLNNRRVRRPYQLRDVATALSLAAEGGALRHRFDPEAMESSDPDSFGLYTDVVKALLLFYTEHDGGDDQVQREPGGPVS